MSCTMFMPHLTLNGNNFMTTLLRLPDQKIVCNKQSRSQGGEARRPSPGGTSFGASAPAGATPAAGHDDPPGRQHPRMGNWADAGLDRHRARWPSEIPPPGRHKVLAVVSSGDLTHWLAKDQMGEVQELVDLAAGPDQGPPIVSARPRGPGRLQIPGSGSRPCMLQYGRCPSAVWH